MFLCSLVLWYCSGQRLERENKIHSMVIKIDVQENSQYTNIYIHVYN